MVFLGTVGGFAQSTAQRLQSSQRLHFTEPPLVGISELEPEEISIVQLQSMAIGTHPQLSKLRYDINAAQGQWMQSGLYPNPELSLNVNEFNDRGLRGKQEIGVSQEIVTGGKLQLSQRVAAKEIDSVKRKYQSQFLALQNNVKLKAWEYLAARQTVALQSELLGICEESVQAAEKMLSIKEVSLVDLLQIRSKRNEVALQLKKAKNNEENAWQQLITVIGQPGLSKRKISDVLEMDCAEIDRELAWKNVLEQSPEIQLAQIDVNVAGSVLQREVAERKSNFTVNATYGYDSTENEPFGNIGLTVPVQLFNRNQGNIVKSKANLASANRQIDVIVLQLRNRFLETYNKYENARESVITYRNTILPDVEKNLELCVKGYKQGEFSYLELLYAQQNYNESQLLLIESLKELSVAKTLLEGSLYLGEEGQ